MVEKYPSISININNIREVNEAVEKYYKDYTDYHFDMYNYCNKNSKNLGFTLEKTINGDKYEFQANIEFKSKNNDMKRIEYRVFDPDEFNSCTKKGNPHDYKQGSGSVVIDNHNNLDEALKVTIFEIQRDHLDDFERKEIIS